MHQTLKNYIVCSGNGSWDDWTSLSFLLDLLMSILNETSFVDTVMHSRYSAKLRIGQSEFFSTWQSTNERIYKFLGDFERLMVWSFLKAEIRQEVCQYLQNGRVNIKFSATLNSTLTTHNDWQLSFDYQGVMFWKRQLCNLWYISHNIYCVSWEC